MTHRSTDATMQDVYDAAAGLLISCLAKRIIVDADGHRGDKRFVRLRAGDLVKGDTPTAFYRHVFRIAVESLARREFIELLRPLSPTGFCLARLTPAGWSHFNEHETD